MEAKLIDIGNSKGIRLPRKVLAAARLAGAERIKLTITKEGLLITPADDPRAGWSEAFRAAPDRKREDLWEGVPIAESWDK